MGLLSTGNWNNCFRDKLQGEKKRGHLIQLQLYKHLGGEGPLEVSALGFSIPNTCLQQD